MLLSRALVLDAGGLSLLTESLLALDGVEELHQRVNVHCLPPP